MSAIYPSLAGKVVLITGGAEGIGAATVEAFSRQGSTTLFLDIATTSAEALIANIKISKEVEPEKNDRTTIPIFHHCDVTDLPALQHLAQIILAEYGRIDVLVNNAAAAGSSSRIATNSITPESWQKAIDINLRHVFFLTQAVVPSMQARRSGSIINLGSITWRIPTSDTPVYAATKAAIMGLTKTHSREFGAWGVRVNSVMPGSIATERQIKEVLTEEYRAFVRERQSLQRELGPEEVANVILFLASDDSRGVTGSSYVVDGGWVSDA